MSQNLERPPFCTEACVALTYVVGRYTPGLDKRRGPEGFLGIYLAKRDPRLSFWVFDRTGERYAFSVITTHEYNVEYALIVGRQQYGIPFDQWHIFDLGRSETRLLQRLGLVADYKKARKHLGMVLYQARGVTYAPLHRKPRGYFTVQLRSRTSLRRDVAERDAILRSIGSQS